MAVERLNTPAVELVAEGFDNDVMSAASSRGMLGLRYVSQGVPGECVIPETIREKINEKVMDEIIAALTKPLTEQEKNPKKEIKELPRIVFKGTLQEVNRFFYQRGWADGLPIIPPTEDAVQEMLTGTDLPADHVVAELIPRLGKATVEKIAVNAVMAGALPTYMPLLITAVQLLADPESRFGTFGVSTGSWAPFWIVNGPVRHDADVYGGIGALSPGRMANATLGRAMGLVAKNIGGARPGIEDMGTHGNPCKYSMVLGENEEESPWEPLHIQQGFNKEDSTITMFWPSSYVQVLAYSADGKGVLNAAVYNIPPGRGGMLCLLVNPTFAKILADEGWTKKEMERFIKEHARCPRHKHWYNTIGTLPLEGTRGFIPFNDTDSMPLIVGNEQVRIVVSGKYSSHVGLAMGPTATWETFITKKVELPANWVKLVKKYKNIVPSYASY